MTRTTSTLRRSKSWVYEGEVMRKLLALSSVLFLVFAVAISAVQAKDTDRLIKQLKDSNPDVRAAAARSLCVG